MNNILSIVLKHKNKLIFLLFLLLLEMTLFQYRYYMPFLTGSVSGQLDPNAITLLTKYDNIEGKGKRSAEGFIIDGKTFLEIDLTGYKTPLCSLRLVVADGTTYKMQVKWMDEGDSVRVNSGVDKTITPGFFNTDDYHLHTQGNCKKAILIIDKKTSTDSNFSVTEIGFNNPHFTFRISRVLLFFFAGIFISWVVKKRLWCVPAGYAKGRQLALNVVTLVFVLFMLCIFVLSPGVEKNTEHCDVSKITYEEPDQKDAYMKQTEAFANGRVSLDIDVSDSLKALPNPYDNGARKGVTYTWDFAYYNGNYYSYFGVVPVLFFLLPFRLITGMYFSSYYFSFLLALAALFVLSRLYDLITRTFLNNTRPFLYTAGLITVLSGSLLAFISARSWFYEIPYASGMLLVFSSLYYAIRASQEKKRCNLYVGLSSLFLALAVGCRPVCAVSFLLCLPFLLTCLKQKAIKKEKLITTAFYVIPLGLAAVLLCGYNYIRFGSFTEFGTTYQLTVSDISYNTLLSIPVVLSGVSKYLFQTPQLSGTFPFFRTPNYTFIEVSQYSYSGGVAGIFSYPVSWTLLLLPKLRKDSSKTTRKLFVFILLLLISGTILIFASSAMGGVNERYMLDFQWMFITAAVLAGIYFCNLHDTGNNGFATLVFSFFMLLSCAVLISISFIGEYNRVTNAYPEFFAYLRDVFEFVK